MKRESVYYVWNPAEDIPRVEHPTEEEARTEAERLARLQPKDKFVILKKVAECVYNPVFWVEYK